MNARSRQALQWLAVAAIVFLGLLLLFFAAGQTSETANPARQDLSWPVLQTIVAFVLFDIALLAGLVIARLRSRPTSLSPKGLLALAAIASFLALGLLVVVLNWPLAPADLLWTLVLISGFGLLLAVATAWSTSRETSKRSPQPMDEMDEPQPAPTPTDTHDALVGDPIPQATSDPPAKDLTPEHDDPLTYLTSLLEGDREAAERLVVMEQTLDPGASHRECVARAVYKLVRDRA